MKKSEAIKLIAKRTNLGYGIDYDDLDYCAQLMADQAAGLVLACLEEKGMLPPTVNYDNRQEEFFNQNIWEPEDEEK